LFKHDTFALPNDSFICLSYYYWTYVVYNHGLVIGVVCYYMNI